ncbi:MAG TPA: hypothetical protein VLA87_04485, partial [Gaiellaceae bacterium]|nr:hypothetical protein [Gaiellaceae bacterium]
MPRLRRSDCSRPGISRRRRGRGFEYRRDDGRLIRDRRELERIRSLAVPPAWTDVWICADPLGHLQATGVDSAGRRQYLYHDAWRKRRDREKFERMLDFAAALRPLRAQTSRWLAADGLGRERVLSCAVRLLDLGFFRIGSEAYAEDNGTFGLATMLRSHVALRDDHGVTRPTSTRASSTASTPARRSSPSWSGCPWNCPSPSARRGSSGRCSSSCA